MIFHSYNMSNPHFQLEHNSPRRHLIMFCYFWHYNTVLGQIATRVILLKWSAMEGISVWMHAFKDALACLSYSFQCCRGRGLPDTDKKYRSNDGTVGFRLFWVAFLGALPRHLFALPILPRQDQAESEATQLKST